VPAFNATDIDVAPPDSLLTARTAALTCREAVQRLGVRLGVLLEGRSLEITGLYAGLERA